MAGDGDGRMECGIAEREANADCSMSLPDRSEKLAAAKKKLRKFQSRNAQKSLAHAFRSDAQYLDNEGCQREHGPGDVFHMLSFEHWH